MRGNWRHAGLLGLSLLLAGGLESAASACGRLPDAPAEERLEEGYQLDRQGDYEGAIKAFKEVLERFPHHRKAQYFLANTYWRDDDFQEAAKAWVAVLRANPVDKLGIEARTWLAKFAHLYQGGALVRTYVGGAAGFADGQAAAARLNRPWGMAMGPTGNIYISDTGNHRLRRVTPEGIVLTVAGSGTAGIKDGPARTALLNNPKALALDPVGNLFFADGPYVRFLTPGGLVGTLVGQPQELSGKMNIQDGRRGSATTITATALTCDRDGNVYMADNGTCIRRITPEGVVTTLAGTVSAGYRDGTGSEARFKRIEALRWTSDNVIVALDAGNNRIRAMSMNGEVRSLAGCSRVGYVDGPLALAHFRGLAGMAIDSGGNLILADSQNFAIRRITPAQKVETVAGGVSTTLQDGYGFQAGFSSPGDVAVTARRIYVLDRGAHAVRTIQLAGYLNDR